MEVAGQWRREWAGTAEYGKVTEGGVTRRIARAMEVLNASGPGARVRVMRAAYHSTAGPGIPAASYMLHSSRRVISSGFNLLESPSLPSKPLEISSTPLEPFRDLSVETDNYKVTEPDDTEISEPSKWRVASGGSSIRMPSEESSSTDNASIIDLDNRSSHKNVFRKYSHDSENSDIQPSKRNSARASPLLDAPTTLSTLKYKSLLNGSNDWNNRRKSYSFEDTCPVNETIIHSNDTLAMESSTDSGICKSSEKVNDQADDNMQITYLETKQNKHESNDETFKDWLHKHRPNTLHFYKGTQLKPCKEHEIDKTLEQAENNIILQSSGKVSITVPMTIEKRDEYTSEEADRRVKKVEFCKTELHFAAESGKVNIIATDEKPPPSNDFRKRRSAFVPITDTFERPVTLFSEKRDIAESIHCNDFSIYSTSETNDYDENENTAATKSILKNKIPKPKPYLLGENMVFGNSGDFNDKGRTNEDAIVPLGVSLINKQLQVDRKYSNGKISTFSNAIDTSHTSNFVRTTEKGPSRNEGSNIESIISDDDNNNATLKNKTNVTNSSDSVRNTLDVQLISPVQKPKTRKLRDSDLMYFGIDNNRKSNSKDKMKYVESVLTSNFNLNSDILQSVKLIKQVSNSAANSEAESEDAPEYQNIPVVSNIIPVPTPRPRSKYDKMTEIEKGRILQPILEQSNQNIAINTVQELRKSRPKKGEDVVLAPRSRSEPSKNRPNAIIEKTRRNEHVHINNIKRDTPSPRLKKHQGLDRRTTIQSHNKVTHKNSLSEAETPLYINLNIEDEVTKKSTRHHKSQQKRDKQIETRLYLHGCEDNTNDSKNYKSPEKPDSYTLNKHEEAHDTSEKTSNKKTNNIKRTKKLVTPENSFCSQSKTEEDVFNNRRIKTSLTNARSVLNENGTSSMAKVKQRRNLSSQRHSNTTEELNVKSDELKQQTATIKEDIEKHGPKYRNRHQSKEQTNTRKNTAHHDKIIHNHDLKVVNNTVDRKSGTETISKKTGHRTPRRSEYVINYDDKNGTVSSVCKVKPDHSSPKRKTKESSKDTKIKNNMIDKTPLLQLPDRQWNQNGLPHENKKWKTKIYAQRSCQLL